MAEFGAGPVPGYERFVGRGRKRGRKTDFFFFYFFIFFYFIDFFFIDFFFFIFIYRKGTDRRRGLKISVGAGWGTFNRRRRFLLEPNFPKANQGPIHVCRRMVF